MRFPGLKIRRLIPCPGHGYEPCSHHFDYPHLQKAIEQDPPREHLQCPESFENVPVPTLLFGIHWRSQEALLDRINVLAKSVAEKHDESLTELRALRELAQREFTNIYRREQSKIESHCPNVFALRHKETAGWKKAIIGKKVELHLYCQSPGCWHPTGVGGVYQIDNPAKWIIAMAPIMKGMVKLLKHVSPLVGPWVSVSFQEYAKVVEDDITLMTQLVEMLPDFEVDRAFERDKWIQELEDEFLFSPISPEHTTGAALRAIRQLLDEKDPSQQWGGLRKKLTPEGHYLWLCDYHEKEFQE